MKKTKKHAKVLGMLLTLVLLICFVSTAIPADAAGSEYEPLTVTIPFKHVYTTTDTTVDDVFH